MNRKVNDLNPELFNRVSIWEEALRNSYHYLLSIQKMTDFNFDKNGYVFYQINDRQGSFHKGLTTNQALLEASVINFTSVFSSGHEGNMIAGQRNPRIIELKEKLIEMSILKLKWSREEFNDFVEKIKLPRNTLLAHYDGNAGDYKEITEGLSSRKMVGVNILEDDMKKFKEVVKTILENAHKIAYGN